MLLDRARARISAAVVATSGSTVNNFLTDDTGAVLAFSSTVSGITTSYVPIQDGMGSTVALVDQNGNLTNTYTYDPAGSVTKTGTVSFPYQYGGGEFDSQTGLYHVGSYYDPVLERLISGATPTGAAGPSLAGGVGPAAIGSSGSNFGAPQIGINAGIGAGVFAYAAIVGAAAAAKSVSVFFAALGSGSVLGPAAIVAAGVVGILDAIDIFGGGGSPFIPYKLRVPAHTIQSGLIGAENGLVWAHDNADGEFLLVGLRIRRGHHEDFPTDDPASIDPELRKELERRAKDPTIPLVERNRIKRRLQKLGKRHRRSKYSIAILPENVGEAASQLGELIEDFLEGLEGAGGEFALP